MLPSIPWNSFLVECFFTSRSLQLHFLTFEVKKAYFFVVVKRTFCDDFISSQKMNFLVLYALKENRNYKLPLPKDISYTPLLHS